MDTRVSPSSIQMKRVLNDDSEMIHRDVDYTNHTMQSSHRNDFHAVNYIQYAANTHTLDETMRDEVNKRTHSLWTDTTKIRC
jgi:hypothetical protein